jgi:PEP-CTERM motif
VAIVAVNSHDHFDYQGEAAIMTIYQQEHVKPDPQWLPLLRAMVMSALLLTSGFVAAAPIPFYPSLSGQSSGDIGEGRWTYFELLNDVTLTQLGVIINPTAVTNRFQWDIYSVNTSGFITGQVFQTTVSYADDDALTTKNSEVDIDLVAGNYVIGLTTLDAPWQIMGGPNSVSGGYFGPGFMTVDGNFRLWDAGSSTLISPLQPGNTGLIPGFSVNISGFDPDPNDVPEPATLALLVAALIGVTATRRRKPTTATC